MPFGLCNAPATFEQLWEKVLAGLLLSVCLVYLNDILIPARSFEGHIHNLRTVLCCLQDANLKLSPKKCTLFRRQLKFLGHIVSKEGVSTDPEKLDTVVSWPRPNNVSECTEHVQVFDWNEDLEKAFADLKRALVEAPVLGYPDPNCHFIVDTDASAYGLGAVLSQIQDGEEKVVANYSCAMSRPERQYCVTRRELLAVVRAVQHFHPYLYGRSFIIRTDHAALRWLLSFRSPEGQVARWLERLQQYDFQIEHRAGANHGNADALSRRPCFPDGCRHCERLDEKASSECPDSPASSRRTQQLIPFWNVADLQQAQREDSAIDPVT